MSVTLSKGQQISLAKTGGHTPSLVRMGLGWKSVARKGLLARLTARDIDLDASAILFSAGEPQDVVFFEHLASNDGSVHHSGDNLTGGTGHGEEDEWITVDLEQVPTHIDQIVFVATSFTGQTFDEVESAFCRLVDETTDEELARYTLSGGGRHTSQIMAKVQRDTGGWTMTAIGSRAGGRTFQDLMPAIGSHL
ncbi:TerD family protein [Streptomyces sp. NPDC059169]|uniref:TerD family protein n=1 Tax=Streptomyces sp. NPDC059169 TaxID=3346754 RepID=UPI0036CD1858